MPAPAHAAAHPPAQTDPTASGQVFRAPSRRPLALPWLIAAIVAFALYYLVAYLPARGNGSDFQVFYAGAVADQHGVNPFDWPSMWQVEQQVYNGGVGHGAPFAFAPYADPPPFALLSRPLTSLNEADAYRLWAVFILLCGALGAYLAVPEWPSRSRILAATLTAISPVVLFDLRLGQNSTPLLLALGAALWFTARKQPLVAGLCLGCGLLKPHLMLPIAVIVILAAPREARKPMAAGLLIAALTWGLVGILFDGGFAAYGHWLSSARQFGDSIRHQPDLASIPGLYLGTAGATMSGLLNAVCLAGAAGIIALLAIRAAHGVPWTRQDLLGAGIATYLALSPY
ncbi:MAG: glycosyltransferase family 87 protein, partial [Chloroflexota bacterium]